MNVLAKLGSVCVPALFSETPPAIDMSGISTQIQSSFQSASVQTVSIIGSIAPYAITIFVLNYVWRQGKKFFSKMGN